MHRGNEAGRLRRITQDPAELANGDAHHRIADCGLRPDGVQQGVFRHQPVRMGHQVVQHGEGFGRQGNGLRPTPETGVVRIEAKVGKHHWEEGIHDLLFSHLGVGHVSEVSKRMIPQPPAKHGKTLRAFTKIYSIFTRLLRHLYDFPPTICHIL